MRRTNKNKKQKRTNGSGIIWCCELACIKSPKTKTLADLLIERTSSMLDETESKTVHKAEEGDQ